MSTSVLTCIVVQTCVCLCVCVRGWQKEKHFLCSICARLVYERITVTDYEQIIKLSGIGSLFTYTAAAAADTHRPTELCSTC